MVFHGDDGLDELCTTAPSTVHELIRTPVATTAGRRHVSVSVYRVDPAELGLARATLDDCGAATPRSTPRRSGRWSRGRCRPTGTSPCSMPRPPCASSVVEDLADGVRQAGLLIDSGRAAGVLDDSCGSPTRRPPGNRWADRVGDR